MKNFGFGTVAPLIIAMLGVFATPTHADEGHHYQGASGFAAEFYLIGGQYHLSVNAHQSFSRATSHDKWCTFAGHTARMWPTQDTLTMGPVAVGTVQYTFDRDLTLPAGLYRMFVTTDCLWSFFVYSTRENAAGIAPVQMLITTGGKAQLSTTTSLSDTMQFSADFRTDHNAIEPASGTLQIIHDGQIVGSLPLQAGNGLPTRGQVFLVNMQWRPGDEKYLGKNIAKFIVKIGSVEFTSSEEFTLTP